MQPPHLLHQVDKLTITNAKGEKFSAVADRKGSFDKILYNGNMILQNNYNAYGELVKTEDKLSGAVTTYAYNTVGALKQYSKSKSGSSYTESVKYDVKGRKEKITYLGTVTRTDEVTYSSSANDKIIKMTTGGYVASFNEDEQGRFCGKSVVVNGMYSEYFTIDYIKENDHLTNLPESICFNEDFFTYHYDNNGNISHIYCNGVLAARYKYDTANRLIREDNLAFSKSYFFSYDNNGNIITREESGYTTSDSYTLGMGAVTSISYTKDRMNSFKGQSCTYDAVVIPLYIAVNKPDGNVVENLYRLTA